MILFRFVLILAATAGLSLGIVSAYENEGDENKIVAMTSQPQQSSLLRGTGEGRGLSFWTCPLIKCSAPCLDDTCSKDETCRTKKTYLSMGKRKCPGCPVFDKCVLKKKKPPVTTIVCPLRPCANPCGICEVENKICQTKPTFFYVSGKKCPGCPTLVSCDDPVPTNKCGPTICQDGFECCNASCGICTRPGGVCTQQACVDPPPTTECGTVRCDKGLVCCNASCGICTPPDGACTQQVCDPVY